ncbi:MAG: hypothetical protein K2X49_04205 [Acetobacteraceae bacterium]|nr:hypothetical protein [Acetobacteraceae bacterium]
MRASPVAVPRAEAHFFVARPRALARDPHLRRFRDWLLAEAAVPGAARASAMSAKNRDAVA